MMGGSIGSKSQMNYERFLMFSLVMLEMFLNTVSHSWHTLVSTYSALSGVRKDQVTANLNIHFGVVLHEPLAESVSDNEDENGANE